MSPLIFRLYCFKKREKKRLYCLFNSSPSKAQFNLQIELSTSRWEFQNTQLLKISVISNSVIGLIDIESKEEQKYTKVHSTPSTVAK